MILSTALGRVRTLTAPTDAPPVVFTVIGALIRELCPEATFEPDALGEGVLALQTLPAGESATGTLRVQVDGNGTGVLSCSPAHYWWLLLCQLEEEWGEWPLDRFEQGFSMTPAFAWHRPLFDLFMTQVCRTARGWDREAYVAELARLGFTHLEVNGLAAPWPFEPGVPDECLHRFYTYCPALDQFVESRLNRGTYPAEYLDANLERLRRDAELGLKYGLTPALLCFEPRSVPETLLRRYPMLRGARVDHPFRSLKPRYNLSIAHPAVREHYAELVENLVREVPELGCLELWSNDSGAAFEHTSSVYAGRNGGAYLIREWRTHEQIADVAGDNLVRFLATLRDGGRRVNPDFRVILRAEPFWAERERVDAGLEEGLDLSLSSLLTKGWDMPYHHPAYEDVTGIGTTLYHHRFDSAEGEPLRRHAQRGVRTHVMASHGAFCNFEPLLGVPAPWLALEKLADMHRAGVGYVGQLGGVQPPDLVPWPVNQEVCRAFRLEPEADPDALVEGVARRWAGAALAPRLVEGWRLTELAIRAFPVPVQLYMMYGFVWYRLWTRPLVPNIEALSEADREYYERHLLITPHNPQRIDLMRDVLFDLTDPASAAKAVERIDAHLWAPLDEARAHLDGVLAELDEDDPAQPLFLDQSRRLQALRCWFMTSRNVAAWIAGVHGFMAAATEEERVPLRNMVREAVLLEMENTQALIELWEGAGETEFMIVSDQGESTFIHGEAFGTQLRRRLELMQGREDDEPFADPDYIWRQSTPDLPEA